MRTRQATTQSDIFLSPVFIQTLCQQIMKKKSELKAWHKNVFFYIKENVKMFKIRYCKY